MKQGCIYVEVYHDSDGNMTCAKDFSTGEVCEFYRSQRFGTEETCLFAPSSVRYSTTLKRRGDNGLGSLIPGDWCPIKVSE